MAHGPLPILGFAVLIRRRFLLFSGVYDVALSLTGALLRYSSAGISRSLSKFLPEVGASSGRGGVWQFLRQITTMRLLLLVGLLVPLNVFADPVARRFDLGPDGSLYIRLVSVLALARAVVDLSIAVLNTFFAQLWSNLFGLFKTLLDAGLVGLVLLLGFDMAGVLGAMAASAGIVAMSTAGFVVFKLDDFKRSEPSAQEPPPATDPPERWLAGHGARFGRFTVFMYVTGLLGFFEGLAFFAPALAFFGGATDVALFATAYNVAFSSVSLVLAGFRGLYQPVFARLRLRNDPAQPFSVLAKGQLLMLLPAGAGLVVLCGDYIALLFGPEFSASTSAARIFIAFAYVSTAFNLSRILLTVDERYQATLVVRLVPVIMAPVFLLVAALGPRDAAAVVAGGTHMTSACLAYELSRRACGVRFPWRFAGRVAVVSLGMAAIVSTIRSMLVPTPTATIALTLVGVAVFCAGLRVASVVGPDEIDLLRRSRLPGRDRIIALLAPRRVTVRPR